MIRVLVHVEGIDILHFSSSFICHKPVELFKPFCFPHNLEKSGAYFCKCSKVQIKMSKITPCLLLFFSKFNNPCMLNFIPLQVSRDTELRIGRLPMATIWGL